MQQDLQQGQGEVIDSNGQSPRKPKNEVLEWIKAIAIALVLVILIRWLLFKPFIVDGPSMKPNFHTGERVIVNEILYDIRKPERGKSLCSMCPLRAGISLNVSLVWQATPSQLKGMSLQLTENL